MERSLQEVEVSQKKSSQERSGRACREEPVPCSVASLHQRVLLGEPRRALVQYSTGSGKAAATHMPYDSTNRAGLDLSMFTPISKKNFL